MTTAIDWESALTLFLRDLAGVQERILSAITEKRARMAAGDLEGLQATNAEEESLANDLRQCHERREGLLAQARERGLPATNLRALAAAVGQSKPAKDNTLSLEAEQVARSLRLLNHECLTNFVLAQRTWLHLTQLVEIIATGGRTKPTYGKDGTPAHSGALVDRVA